MSSSGTKLPRRALARDRICTKVSSDGHGRVALPSSSSASKFSTHALGLTPRSVPHSHTRSFCLQTIVPLQNYLQ